MNRGSQGGRNPPPSQIDDRKGLRIGDSLNQIARSGGARWDRAPLWFLVSCVRLFPSRAQLLHGGPSYYLHDVHCAI